LCYLSADKTKVRSSLLFMGHVHDVNAQRLARYFAVPDDEYKRTETNPEWLGKVEDIPVFFQNGWPDDYVDIRVEPEQFTSFSRAYHQLMTDLTRIALNSLKMIIPVNDQTKKLYVSGGFNRNFIFIHLLQQWLPKLTVVPSHLKNATALGAAMIINQNK
jgi:sugar (pentulose or hexulose) kinase